MDMRRVKPSRNLQRFDPPRARKESREIQRPDEPIELAVERVGGLIKQLDEAKPARKPMNREEISRKLRRFRLPGSSMLGGR